MVAHRLVNAPAARSMTLGETRLTLVPDGEMHRPSGKGVYGVPGASGWADHTPPDERGAIALMPCSLLIRGPVGTVLVDTGGESPEEVPGRRSSFLEELGALGVRPEDVGTVVLTHAHLDHIGYNTRRVRGEWTPTFPNAAYFIQEVEAESFRRADPARWARYFAPLEEAGCLRYAAGDAEIAPGLTCLATPGHTVGHQSVLVECGRGGSAIYLGDLAVTKLHLEHPDWHPEWCWSVADERASKDRVTRLALELDALLVFGHDPRTPWGRLAAEGDGVRVVPVRD